MNGLTPAQLALASAGPQLGRKKSVAGSVMSVSTGARRNMQPEFDFNLGMAKAKVMKAIEESAPAGFVHFCQGALFDRLLHSLILYFCALFQHEALVKCMERSRQQHLEGYNPYLVAARLKELEDEANTQRQGLSQPYCEILLKHSSYKKPQTDKRFFEALYSALAAVLDEAFDRVGKHVAIEQELGRLFRGRHFNSAARTHGPQRTVDTLTVTEIYNLKNETENRSLHAKLISGLYERPPSLGVQVASLSNSPLVSQAVSSPMVIRSLLADPQERDALLELPYSRKKKEATGAAAEKLTAAFKGVAAAQGVDPKALSTPAAIRALQPTTGTLNAAGILASRAEELSNAQQSTSSNPHAGPHSTWTAQPAGAGVSSASATTASGSLSSAATPSAARASTLKPFQGTVASLPEASGLPYDEGYAYLCLLRRYILYGPTLGLATAPVMSGRQPGMSLTGTALAASQAGGLSAGNSQLNI